MDTRFRDQRAITVNFVYQGFSTSRTCTCTKRAASILNKTNGPKAQTSHLSSSFIIIWSCFDRTFAPKTCIHRRFSYKHSRNTQPREAIHQNLCLEHLHLFLERALLCTRSPLDCRQAPLNSRLRLHLSFCCACSSSTSPIGTEGRLDSAVSF